MGLKFHISTSERTPPPGDPMQPGGFKRQFQVHDSQVYICFSDLSLNSRFQDLDCYTASPPGCLTGYTPHISN